jgi:hypothetical protein
MPRRPITFREHRTATGCLAIAIGCSGFGILAGCQKRAHTVAPVATYPVHGTLMINGAPAPGAMVKFMAEKHGGRAPTAIVRADGGFSASYYDTEDGAPAGEYKLLVVWMQTPPGGGLARDILGGRFLDPARPVATVRVREAENLLPPIELTTRTEIHRDLLK